MQANLLQHQDWPSIICERILSIWTKNDQQLGLSAIYRWNNHGLRIEDLRSPPSSKQPIGSMYGIYVCSAHSEQNQPDVGKSTITHTLMIWVISVGNSQIPRAPLNSGKTTLPSPAGPKRKPVKGAANKGGLPVTVGHELFFWWFMEGLKAVQSLHELEELKSDLGKFGSCSFLGDDFYI